MKKSFVSIALGVFLALGSGSQAMYASAFNYSPDSIITTSIENIGNDIVVTTEFSVSNSSKIANQKTASVSKTYKKGSETIAKIGISGTFEYDGNTVKVKSKSVTPKTVYSGWSFSQESFTSSGGEISLLGKLSNFWGSDVPVDISLSCDKNGNIDHN